MWQDKSPAKLSSCVVIVVGNRNQHSFASSNYFVCCFLLSEHLKLKQNLYNTWMQKKMVLAVFTPVWNLNSVSIWLLLGSNLLMFYSLSRQEVLSSLIRGKWQLAYISHYIVTLPELRIWIFSESIREYFLSTVLVKKSKTQTPPKRGLKSSALYYKACIYRAGGKEASI